MSSVSLQSVILGESPADLVIRGGRVLSTTRRELLSGALAISDGRVAGIHEDPAAVIGPETRVIDAEDGIVAPGFIDAHTHLDLHQAFEQTLPETLAGGTTSIVSEVAAFGPAFGPDGVEAFIDATESLPVRVFATIPPHRFFDMFEAPRADQAENDAFLDLLARDRVVGVGETAWIRMVGRESGAQPLYDRAHELGKTVSGHGAGVSGARLQAFGEIVTDDHEAISPDGIRDRVASGIHPIGRYGSIRDDMGALIEAWSDTDASELSLSTDGMWPRDLVDEGYMDAVLRRVIDGGVDPIYALVMATRSPARHFGLDGLGSLTPGTPADIVILDGLESPHVVQTIVGGEVVVGEDGPVVERVTVEYPAQMMGLPPLEFDLGDFVVPERTEYGPQVRAIEYGGGLLSGATSVSPARTEGELRADPDADVLKLALFDRAPDGDRSGFTGFVTGFGLDTGAVATTLTWETAGLLVLGTSSETMAAAANRVVEMAGGWTVVDDDGSVLADLPTPIGATCSATPPEETADGYSTVESAVMELGATVDRPLLGLQTISFFGVPSLKMAFDGYADIRRGEIVGLPMDE